METPMARSGGRGPVLRCTIWKWWINRDGKIMTLHISAATDLTAWERQDDIGDWRRRSCVLLVWARRKSSFSLRGWLCIFSLPRISQYLNKVCAYLKRRFCICILVSGDGTLASWIGKITGPQTTVTVFVDNISKSMRLWTTFIKWRWEQASKNSLPTHAMFLLSRQSDSLLSWLQHD